MESTIAAQCIVEQDAGLVLNMAGNKLSAGSVIMCQLTAFVIMEDGDIDYIGSGKMEMVYHANDWYFKFLDQQVKELRIERSQGFITSMFTALTGSRHKTRRKQVTRIPPTPVTIGTYYWLRTWPWLGWWLYNQHQLSLRRNQQRILAQAMIWGSFIWWMFNAAVNMSPYIVLMWRSMSSSQTILMNN